MQSMLSTNLITNGDFSSGNTGFTSGYTYGASPGPILYEGHYAIDTDPHNVHNGFASYGDHTSGTGNMLIINGAPSVLSFWCETVTVSANTNYIFSVWTANCSNTFNSPAQIQLQINGSQVGTIFQPVNAYGQWTQYQVTWNSGSNTSAAICLYDQNTAAAGNDFTVDDISFYPVCVSNDSVYIKVYNLNPTVSTPQTLCSGSILNLTASDTTTGVSYNWTGPGSFNSSLQNPIIANAQVSNSGSYTVTVSINGCSATANTSATVNPLLGPPIITISIPSDTICAGSNAIFTAATYNVVSPGYQWIKNGVAIIGATSSTYTVNALNISSGDIITCKVTSTTLCQPVDTNMSNAIQVHLISLLPPPVTLSQYPANYSSGNIVTFSSHVPNGSTGLTYKWTKNGIVIPGATSGTYTTTNVNAGDTICVIIYSNKACTFPDSSIACTELVTGVTSFQSAVNNVNVYPNPNNGTFTISGKGYNCKQAAMELINTLGQLVYKDIIQVENGVMNKQVYINSKVTDGVYLLRIITNSESESVPLIIKR